MTTGSPEFRYRWRLLPEPLSLFAPLWRSFTSAPTTATETPGIRADWHKGRPRYAVWVVRVSHPAVNERVAALGQALKPWLIPQPDLHVTLAIAGFPSRQGVEDDDVSEDVLAAQADAVAAWARATSFRVHGACAFMAAPFLCVTDDHHSLRDLRALLDPPGRALSIEAYVPHVTVGRWNGAHATAAVALRMEPFRNGDPIDVKADAVELVDYDAADPQARLVTKVRVPMP